MYEWIASVVFPLIGLFMVIITYIGVSRDVKNARERKHKQK